MPLFSRAPSVISTTVGDELVLLNPDTEVFFSLNESAASIWELLAQPHTEDALIDALLQDYDVSEQQCRAAVGEFLAQAKEHGVLHAA